VEGGARALADGARRGQSQREVELERRLEEVTSALGEAHVELRLLRRGGAGAFPSKRWG
jgi:transposase